LFYSLRCHAAIRQVLPVGNLFCSTDGCKFSSTLWITTMKSVSAGPSADDPVCEYVKRSLSSSSYIVVYQVKPHAVEISVFSTARQTGPSSRVKTGSLTVAAR
jgi:hypothetical protein